MGCNENLLKCLTIEDKGCTGDNGDHVYCMKFVQSAFCAAAANDDIEKICNALPEAGTGNENKSQTNYLFPLFFSFY